MNIQMTLLVGPSCYNSILIRILPFQQYRQRYAIYSASVFVTKNFATNQDKFPKEKQSVDKNKTAVTDLSGRERSILEEILLEKQQEPKTTGQKVKRAAETTFYIGFGLASLAALGGLSYILYNELFSFSSTQGLYKDALGRVRKDERCTEIYGDQILAHGEESGRGRRRHIANKRFQKNGQERLRIMFHIKGAGKVGRVLAEIAKIDGVWDYRFLIIETETGTHSKHSIVLIDNR